MNMVKNYNLKSVTRWTYTCHPEWCDDPNHAVVSVSVERITYLNGEILNKRIIERQDHVLNLATPESMAAAAYLKMNSTHIDEEVYVGF